VAELKDKLREYVAKKRSEGELHSGRWIVGFGWDQDLMHHNGYPSRWDLDDVLLVLFNL
jgi:predicted amidohydrolase YtcJ